MARYIDAEDFVAEVRKISKSPLNEWDTWGVLSALERVPTADVAPVIHAHWVKNPRWVEWSCTNCNAVQQRCTRYCGWCGAKMDEEVE